MKSEPISSPNSKPITSIILAAGQGTRMNSKNKHKVCHDLKGTPVIGHMLNTFKQCGIKNNVLVVGQMAEQVMQTTAVYDDSALFCFQSEQRGTGHAAKQAARALKKLDYNGLILVTAGDKVFEIEFLKNMINNYQKNPCDLLFVTGPINGYPTSGRVICSNSNQPIGIIEVFDIAKYKTLTELLAVFKKSSLKSSDVKNILFEHLSEEKAKKAFGDFLEILNSEKIISREIFDQYFSHEMVQLTLGGKPLSEPNFDNALEANLSVYLFDAQSLYYAVERLESNNAQNEEYLTDVVEILSQNNAVIKTFPIKNKTNVMAFNNPEELYTIRKTILA